MPKRIPDRYSLIILAIYLIVRVLPTKTAFELMARVLGVSSKNFFKTKNIKSNIWEVFPGMNNQSVKALTKEMVENFGRHLAEIVHITAFRDGRQSGLPLA
jgi:lauroyl/myristoyl acyltransferase